jgi:hypothetical protein
MTIGTGELKEQVSEVRSRPESVKPEIKKQILE